MSALDFLCISFETPEEAMELVSSVSLLDWMVVVFCLSWPQVGLCRFMLEVLYLVKDFKSIGVRHSITKEIRVLD